VDILWSILKLAKFTSIYIFKNAGKLSLFLQDPFLFLRIKTSILWISSWVPDISSWSSFLFRIFYCLVTHKPQHAFNHPSPNRSPTPIGISVCKQDFTYHKQDGATCGPSYEHQRMALNQKM